MHREVPIRTVRCSRVGQSTSTPPKPQRRSAVEGGKIGAR